MDDGSITRKRKKYRLKNIRLFEVSKVDAPANEQAEFLILKRSPDAVTDPAVADILADIAKDPSRGVLVVTHDPRLLPFADRVIHIEDGRIVREEPGGA